MREKRFLLVMVITMLATLLLAPVAWGETNPAPPQGLVAESVDWDDQNPGLVQVYLKWGATINVGVDHYNVYRLDGADWVLVNRVNDPNYVDNLDNAAGPAIRIYRVTAVNPLGNESSPSAELHLTTFKQDPVVSADTHNGYDLSGDIMAWTTLAAASQQWHLNIRRLSEGQEEQIAVASNSASQQVDFVSWFKPADGSGGVIWAEDHDLKLYTLGQPDTQEKPNPVRLLHVDSEQLSNLAVDMPRLVFNKQVGDYQELWLYNLEQQLQFKLADNLAINGAVLSGPHIAFRAIDSTTGQADAMIYAIGDPGNPGDDNLTNLTANIDAQVYDLDLMAEQVVWSDGRDGDRDLYLYNLNDPLDDEHIRKLTDSAGDPMDGYQDYRPSLGRNRVAWETFGDGESGVWVLNLSGGNQEPQPLQESRAATSSADLTVKRPVVNDSRVLYCGAAQNLLSGGVSDWSRYLWLTMLPPATSVVVAPDHQETMEGTLVTVNIDLQQAQNVYGAELVLYYNPAILQLALDDQGKPDVQVNTDDGNPDNGQEPFDTAGVIQVGTDNAGNPSGRLLISATRNGESAPNRYQGFDGDANLATVRFQTIGTGRSPLHLEAQLAGNLKPEPDSSVYLIPNRTYDGDVMVKDSTGNQIRGWIRLEGTPYPGPDQNFPRKTGTRIEVVSQQTGTNSEPVLRRVETTGENGGFQLTSLPEGLYNLTANRPGYLDVKRNGLAVTSDQPVDLGSVLLMTGDLSLNDWVDLGDLMLMREVYGTNSRMDGERFNAAADLDWDGRIGLIDLILLARNFAREGDGNRHVLPPRAWLQDNQLILDAGPLAEIYYATGNQAELPADPVDRLNPGPDYIIYSAENRIPLAAGESIKMFAVERYWSNSSPVITLTYEDLASGPANSGNALVVDWGRDATTGKYYIMVIGDEAQPDTTGGYFPQRMNLATGVQLTGAVDIPGLLDQEISYDLDRAGNASAIMVQPGEVIIDNTADLPDTDTVRSTLTGQYLLLNDTGSIYPVASNAFVQGKDNGVISYLKAADFVRKVTGANNLAGGSIIVFLNPEGTVRYIRTTANDRRLTLVDHADMTARKVVPVVGADGEPNTNMLPANLDGPGVTFMVTRDERITGLDAILPGDMINVSRNAHGVTYSLEISRNIITGNLEDARVDAAGNVSTVTVGGSEYELAGKNNAAAAGLAMISLDGGASYEPLTAAKLSLLYGSQVTIYLDDNGDLNYLSGSAQTFDHTDALVVDWGRDALLGKDYIEVLKQDDVNWQTNLFASRLYLAGGAWISGAADVSGLADQIVDFNLDNKGDILAVQVQPNRVVINNTADRENTNTARASLTWQTMTMKDTGAVYSLAPNAVVKRADDYSYWTVSDYLFNYGFEANNLTGGSIKAVLNKDGLVSYIKTTSNNTRQALVDQVILANKTIIPLPGANGFPHQLPNYLGDPDVTFMVTRDGQIMGLDAIHPGDLVNTLQGVHGVEWCLNVSRNTVTGILEAIKLDNSGNEAGNVKIDGAMYELVGKSDTGMPGLAMLSLDNGRTFRPLNTGELEDLLGSQVTIYLDDNRDINYLITDTQSGLNYGVLSNIIYSSGMMGDGIQAISILQGDGAETTIEVTPDSMLNGIRADEYFLDPVIAVGKLVSFRLNSAGELDKLNVIDDDPGAQVSSWDLYADIKNNRLSILGNFYGIDANTVIFDVSDPDDIIISNWDDLVNTKDRGPDLSVVFKADNDMLQYLTANVPGGLISPARYAMVFQKGINADGYFLNLNTGSAITTYLVAPGLDLSYIGPNALIEYRISNGVIVDYRPYVSFAEPTPEDLAIIEEVNTTAGCLKLNGKYYFLGDETAIYRRDNTSVSTITLNEINPGDYVYLPMDVDGDGNRTSDDLIDDLRSGELRFLVVLPGDGNGGGGGDLMDSYGVISEIGYEMGTDSYGGWGPVGINSITILQGDGSRNTYSITADSLLNGIRADADIDANEIKDVLDSFNYNEVELVAFNLASDGTIQELIINPAGWNTIMDIALDRQSKRVYLPGNGQLAADGNTAFFDATDPNKIVLSNWEAFYNTVKGFYGVDLMYIQHNGVLKAVAVSIPGGLIGPPHYAMVTEKGINADGYYLSLNIGGTVTTYQVSPVLDLYSVNRKALVQYQEAGGKIATISVLIPSAAPGPDAQVMVQAVNPVQGNIKLDNLYYWTNGDTIIFKVGSSTGSITSIKLSDINVGDQVYLPVDMNGWIRYEAMVDARGNLKFLVIRN